MRVFGKIMCKIYVQYVPGKGTHIKFWYDSWMGMPLRYQYPDLFRQFLQKHITLEMASNQRDWDLKFEPYLNEESLSQTQTLMQEIQWVMIQQDVNDVVLWQWEKNKNFTVKSFL